MKKFSSKFMTISKTSPLKKLIYSKDKRKIEFIKRRIKSVLGISLSGNESALELYSMLRDICHHEGISENEMASVTELYFKSEVIRIEDFSWIHDAGARACYFTWIYINFIEASIPKKYRLIPEEKNSLESYFDDIINFFDVKKLTLKRKEQILTSLKLKFRKKISFKHKLIRKIISLDDSDLLNWLWDYLVYKCKLPVFISKPENNNDLSGFILAHLDLWDISDDRKTIILEKAYLAMAQKKHKNKPADLKGDTIWLSAEANQKITKLEEKLKENRKIIIQRLIAQEYSKIIGS